SALWLLPRVADDRVEQKTPALQIALLLVAVLLVSVAGTIEDLPAKIVLIVVSVLSTAAMLATERRSENRLLPLGSVMLSKPIARLYLMMFSLMLVLTSDIYIPYFLQTLHAVPPLVSGYLVALVAMGWTVAALVSASFSNRRASISIIVGCILETVATASLTFLLARDNTNGDIAALVPAVVAMFLMGFGIGLVWAHLVTKVIGVVGSTEQDKASAAISTVQSLGGAFGSSLAGVIVNGAGLADPGGVAGALSASTWLYALMALPGLVPIALSFTLKPASA
ncbi:MAG: MFS transporter, partial [Rhizobiaceae bacterium]|nr:MFS transporter [Rhizobiaceae bacterium]